MGVCVMASSTFGSQGTFLSAFLGHLNAHDSSLSEFPGGFAADVQRRVDALQEPLLDSGGHRSPRRPAHQRFDVRLECGQLVLVHASPLRS